MSNQPKPLHSVTLGQYKGLSVTRHVRTVSDQEVEQELLHQRRLHAHYQLTDRPAQDGSRITLDFEGYLDGKPIPNSRMTNAALVLGSGRLMPAAEQAVYGHCAGETFTFDFTYPEDFEIPELAGQTAQFTLTLHTVAEKLVPEADDTFARGRGYESLEAMKEAIRQKKQLPHEAAADRKAGADLLAAAGANLTVQLDPARLDAAAEQELQRRAARFHREGGSLEGYCQAEGITLEQLRAQCRAAAERQIRSVLAAQAIAEAEGITVSDPEIRAEYRRLSATQNLSEDDLLLRIPPQAMTAALTAQKVQSFLLENACVATVQDPPENLSTSEV